MVVTSDAELARYASPGPLTALVDGPVLSGLPEDAAARCRLAQGLIVHEFLAAAYGVAGADTRGAEVELRRAADIVDTIVRVDPRHRPLHEARAPAERMVGNCRQFTVLTVALLRHGGLPARARAGFAGYFEDGWVDHWVVERWDPVGGVWRRSDPQLDDVQRAMFDLDFDPLDLPAGAFLAGSEAWRRCRRGDDEPQRFGIMDMRGWWFIAGNVVRDLAALQRVELLPWDVWGLMDVGVAEPGDPVADLIDRVADAVLDGDDADRRRAFELDGVRVPDVVHSARSQRDDVIGPLD